MGGEMKLFDRDCD